MAGNNPSKAPVILQLAVPSPLRRLFDYLPPRQELQQSPDFWRPGTRFRVPFGRRQEVAVLVSVARSSELPADRLKHAIALLDREPLLPPPLLQTLDWAAAYYQHPPGEVYATALPVRLRRGDSTESRPTPVWTPAAGVTELAVTPLQRAPKQQELLRLLLTRGQLTREQCKEAGFSNAILQALADKGLVQAGVMQTADFPSGVDPQQSAAVHPGTMLAANPEQQAAIDAITGSLTSYHCHLLDGITGSGKTEVYLQVIASVLEQGRQALVLVPEIGLTPQSVEGFRRRFNCEIVVLHSGLTDSERLQGWLHAWRGSAAIVIGTRSAVFTPLARPGVIVIDEEHDSSFKQQDGFRYSARDLSIFRARAENIPVVLGSATPALESLYNARDGRYRRLQLNERAGSANRPTISLLDLVESETREGFSLTLLDLIKHHLQQENQVLVFINRRGFAPSLACQDCGYEFECRRCDAQLTVHKTPPGLHCHHCESRKPLPVACAACGSRQLLTRGLGTEKTEQFLQESFPTTPIVRIDSDSTRRKHALSERLAQVQSGTPCLLVGTQMLAKGHHFPGVTLVAVLNADTGLFSADFRGQEHMIQLLFQVAGRAGRAQHAGQVVIQTRHASHAALQALMANDYHGIAELLLQERQQSRMPPYSHLALFRAESVQARPAMELLLTIRDLCTGLTDELGIKGIEVHHPLPAPMERKGGRYRAQMLIKASARGPLQRLLTVATNKVETLKEARRTRWSIDVDPQDLT